MAQKRFEEIPHTADWSFRAFGRDLRELFENAAFAMFSLEGAISPQADRSPEIVREIAVTGIDYESLLVNWLSELLYLQESNHETYHRFQIDELSPTALHARAWATPEGNIEKLIKAVTYHNLEIKKALEWQATVVVDV